MAPELMVRRRTESDLEVLARVLGEVHELDGYPVEGVADARGWLMSADILAAWVAVLAGSPVGHVMLTAPAPDDDAVRMWVAHHGGVDGGRPDDVIALGRLFVAPSARRRGAARQLMAMAMAYAHARRRRALLEVMDKDIAAIGLYEQLGWRSMGAIRHGHSGGNVEPATAYLAPAPARVCDRAGRQEWL